MGVKLGAYLIVTVNAEDNIRLETFCIECKDAVESAKLSYLSNLGSELNEPGTTSKNYWKIIHRVMNKCRAPKIPPILKGGTFILNCIRGIIRRSVFWISFWIIAYNSES